MIAGKIKVFMKAGNLMAMKLLLEIEVE